MSDIRPLPFEGDASIPGAVDVVVIGGGIIGLATAWNLANRGLRIAVMEKGVIGGEQSARNWGFCRQQGRDPRELPLMIEAVRLWRNLDRDLGERTGFEQSGNLLLAHDDKSEAQNETWLLQATEFGLPSRVVRGDDLDRLMPGAAHGQWRSGLFTPTDGRAEPQWATVAFANALRARGVTICTNCAARHVGTKAGRVAEVVTESGVVRCEAAVLAGGVWSRPLARSLGVTIKQVAVRASVMRTTPVQSGPDVSMWGGGPNGFSLRRRADGGYTVAHGGVATLELTPDSIRLALDFWQMFRANPNAIRLRLGRRFLSHLTGVAAWHPDRPTPAEAERVLAPMPEQAILSRAIGNLRKTFPTFNRAEVAGSWAGFLDMTPDAVPVISEAVEMPGLFLSTGYSGHGFGIAPGAGRLTADLVTGDTPIVDPAPFSQNRFKTRVELMGGR
jgi:glycine/D-amino acid oxidase-like deaminating enzyme